MSSPSRVRGRAPEALALFMIFEGKIQQLINIQAPNLLKLTSRKRDIHQKWSRGHKVRGQGQGHKKNSRTRTGMLEAKAKDQGHKCKCFRKKKGLKKFFFYRSPKKTVKKNIFQPIYKILTIQKIVLSSSRGQGNFRGLEASRPRA